MKYVFVLNSFTLKKCNIVEERIKNYCKKNNMDYIIEINSSINSTENILKRYKNDKHIVIAVGGDGMINYVLNNIVDTENILGFIPSGTGNDFYRSVKYNVLMV